MTASNNIFINMIYEKVSFSFIHIFKYISHKISLKKFENSILKGSPGFGLLWKMADFIKLAEEVFFYDNSTKNTEFGLYSSRGYTPGQNGFKINTVDTLLVVKLYSDSQKVAVEVERLQGERLKSYLSFTNEQWDSDPNIYNEMMLEQIIKTINNRIIYLFEYLYDRR